MREPCLIAVLDEILVKRERLAMTCPNYRAQAPNQPRSSGRKRLVCLQASRFRRLRGRFCIYTRRDFRLAALSPLSILKRYIAGTRSYDRANQNKIALRFESLRIHPGDRRTRDAWPLRCCTPGGVRMRRGVKSAPGRVASGDGFPVSYR